jgi:hypothetical protein
MTARRALGVALVVALTLAATTTPGREVLASLGDAGRALWAWITSQTQRVDVDRVGRSRIGLAVVLGLAAVAVVVSVAAAFRVAVNARVLATAYLVGAVVGVLLFARGLA